ncbi:DUF3500 domain-containing protein [Actinoplanes sp. NPDC051851]|uniref:DUF3500 domain-containing protein n=1 Tax=Actinoplanes sp. NPDC051851 TaxID=3154753 RepID=UPI0034128991
MKDETVRPAKPAPRRWRGVAIATAAVALLGAGIATANAATVGDKTGGKNTTKAAAAPQDPTKGAKGVAGLVNAANAFLATLDDDQKAEVLIDFSQENAVAWSNLPCAGTCRPGISLGDLDDDQLAAAKAVLVAATGTGKGTGIDQLNDIVAADDLLAADSSGSTGGGTAPSADPSASTDASAAPAPSGAAPSGDTGGGGMALTYGSGYYYLAFMGTPSLTGTWELGFGGHHMAVHITYKNGKGVSASPFFLGVEPTSYTDADGNTVESMKAQATAVSALATSLTTAQKTTATLSETFGDVLVGPQNDGNFPTTKEGIQVSKLSKKQKQLVLNVIKPWVANADEATAAELMKVYEKELDQTFVGLSGGTGYDTQGDYLRIDGPSVWIEFVCQNGVVYTDQIHYHTVYRDHTRDYGGEFTF